MLFLTLCELQCFIRSANPLFDKVMDGLLLKRFSSDRLLIRSNADTRKSYDVDLYRLSDCAFMYPAMCI
jgi:hypothetical protein